MFTLARIRQYYSEHKCWVDYFSAAVFALFAGFILFDVAHLLMAQTSISWGKCKLLSPFLVRIMV